ncbi:MAG: hypothetical protein U0572_15770 [Phycisphaerales bacterium]
MRKARLDRFVELARVYRGWTRAQLSQALGRDSSKLVPESGNPKLDFVVGIADVLDWRLGDVAEEVWLDEPAADPNGASFEELDLQAHSAHRAGDAARMLTFARQMRRVAATPTERAIAANRESGAWDLRGRYVRSLEAVQGGLAEGEIRDDVRLMLHANLANAHYALWHLVEARSIAADLLADFVERPPRTRLERVGEAFAYSVRGHAFRRQMAHGPALARRDLATRARADLERSRERYLRLADETHDRSYEAIAATCRGGLLECAAALEDIEPSDVVQQIFERLGEVQDVSETPRGDWLESYGWWAIFGCNVALRHLEGHELHRAMAVCSNKALEIAERLDNWSMREQAFCMEHFRRRRVHDVTGFEPDWLLDADDVRVLAGAMARFPSFRPIGWQILESARVFEDGE